MILKIISRCIHGQGYKVSLLCLSGIDKISLLCQTGFGLRVYRMWLHTQLRAFLRWAVNKKFEDTIKAITWIRSPLYQVRILENSIPNHEYWLLGRLSLASWRLPVWSAPTTWYWEGLRVISDLIPNETETNLYGKERHLVFVRWIQKFKFSQVTLFSLETPMLSDIVWLRREPSRLAPVVTALRLQKRACKILGYGFSRKSQLFVKSIWGLSRNSTLYVGTLTCLIA